MDGLLMLDDHYRQMVIFDLAKGLAHSDAIDAIMLSYQNNSKYQKITDEFTAFSKNEKPMPSH